MIKVGDKVVIKFKGIDEVKTIETCQWRERSAVDKKPCSWHHVCPGYINGSCYGVEKEFLAKPVRPKGEDDLEEAINREVDKLKGVL